MITLHRFNDNGTLQHVPIISPAKQRTFHTYSPHIPRHPIDSVHLCESNASVYCDSFSHNSHCTASSFFYGHFQHFAPYSLNLKTHYQSTLTTFINCCAQKAEVTLNSAQFWFHLFASSHETYTAWSVMNRQAIRIRQVKASSLNYLFTALEIPHAAAQSWCERCVLLAARIIKMTASRVG
jgi:hypothetical protein